MSTLGWLNMLVLQWFGVRLARVIDTDTRQTVGYRWLRWIVPLTGWRSPYRYIGGR